MMTRQKVREVLNLYRIKLTKMKVKSGEYNPKRFVKYKRKEVLSHCLGMLPQMIVFINEGRMDKVFRWLGFVQ